MYSIPSLKPKVSSFRLKSAEVIVVIKGIIFFVLSLLSRMQFLLQESRPGLDSAGKKCFHIVIFNRVNFKGTFSLLRKGWGFFLSEFLLSKAAQK